jgi:ATP-dependent DNA helicase RecQ
MDLRPFQREALQFLEKPVHLLCIAPTGAGKSLIYETIASEKGRRTLLISPLIALARQQASRVVSLGVPVVLNPGAFPKPAPPKGSGVWIVSPESLQSPRTLERIKKWKPDFLAVDECHCLYDWGEQFRTAFLEVPGLIRKLNISRSVWLTATLPLEARRELEALIGSPVFRVVGKFSLPPNLYLDVVQVPWPYRASFLLERCSREWGAGIVFVSTREATRRVQNLLTTAGRRAVNYHAGLSQEERKSIETRMKTEPDLIMVATSAFGMGMDYPGLKWAVLWQAPASLLSLAQALGRVGRRSGTFARATLLWDEEDFLNQEWLTQGSARRIQSFKEVHSFLMRSECRARALELYFNGIENQSLNTHFCENCDFCQSVKSKSS